MFHKVSWMSGQELYLSHNYMDLKHSFRWTHMSVALGMHSGWGRDAYLKSYWNWLDGIVVMVSIINMVPLGGDGWEDILFCHLVGLTTWMGKTRWIGWLNTEHETNVGSLVHLRWFVSAMTIYLSLTPFPQIFTNPGNIFFPTHFWAHVGALQLEGMDYYPHFVA